MRKTVNKAAALALTLPCIPAPRGRPHKVDALSNAERQRRFRARHTYVETGERIGSTIKKLSDQFGIDELTITRELLRFALCNKNWSQSGFPSLKND